MATFIDKQNRPRVQPPDFGMIPTYVRRFQQWVLWRFDWTGHSWAKVPYDSNGLHKAATNRAETWTTFEGIQESYLAQKDSFDGIGLVFTAEDDLCGIDFDNCIDAAGVPARDKEQWIKGFDSYAEVSVSGTGVHVIVRGVCGAGRKKRDVEIYDRLRYFTFSGKPFGTVKPIQWRQEQIERLKGDMFPESPNGKRTTAIRTGKSPSQLLDLAFASKTGDSIRKLYAGCFDEYGGDHSAADLALCSKLAFWTGGDAAVLDEMFRRSRLYRDKWDKRHSSDGRTYGQMTIQKALEQCADYYKPNGGANSETIKTSGIYYVRDLREELFKLYETGRQPGEQPGWKNLGKYYTVKRRQFTVMTGIPSAGKTAFLDNLMINLAKSAGWKFAVCSVENQPLEEHLSTLLEIYTEQPFSASPTARMQRQVVEEALDWFEDHFVFVLPEESARTLPGIISLVSNLEVDGVVVDPWNELEHRRPPQMTETEYVSQSLSKMRHHARTHNQHWWLVAHPTKLQKDKAGKYHVPTLYDIAGSAHFRNKCDFGLALYRDQEDRPNVTVVFIQKVRFRWCGKIGQCELCFNHVTGKFSEK
jgi:hypothetical protein